MILFSFSINHSLHASIIYEKNQSLSIADDHCSDKGKEKVAINLEIGKEVEVRQRL